MGLIHFLSKGDAEEITKALTAEGYSVVGEHREAGEAGSRAGWAVQVDPFDADVAAMVDVYGGWLPEEVAEEVT